MKRSENYSSNEDLELKADITTEFQMLLDTEVGLDQSRYELETVLEPTYGTYNYHYKADVRILDEDDDMLDSFADNADELYDHLSSEFPRVRFDIRVESGCSAVTASAFEDSDADDGLDGGYVDDSDDDDEDESLEEQFEGEGLRIIDSIDEADSPVYERGEEEDEEEEEEEDERPKRKRKKSELDDELDDVDLDAVDDYEPDEEDREELWKAFGDFDD